jgi:hypothetical protein
MLFSSNNLSKYAIILSIVLVASYCANKFQQSFETNDEYDMIKKYLLNDSPLYGHNRPKLWIHTKYEVNARKWRDFYSRNTTDLNQPYIHLTIKTIINHCGDDFNICLIDDESFSKLIPSWDVDLSTVAEPMKSHFRELGMAQLIYFYGGMRVPNSFVCMRNLKTFYEESVIGNRPFVCESINRTMNNMKQKRKLLFVPDSYFMGAAKNDPVILEYVEYLKKINKTTHISNETDFVGDIQEWFLEKVDEQKVNLVGGEQIGVKTEKRKTILLDNLMEEEYLDLTHNCVGVYIPEDEVLKRPKYQWFAVLPSEQILNSNIIISKYLKASIVDSTDEYHKTSEIRSRTVVSI